jgi:spermidine synthase
MCVASARFYKSASVLFAVLVFSMLLTPAGGAGERQLLETRESKYNSIFVYKSGDLISLTFGLNKRVLTESLYNSKDERDLPIPYSRFMTSPIAYTNQVTEILEIGSGAGRIAWYLHKFLPGASITSVELDPEVADLAKKYFGVRNERNFALAVQDGRLFLKKSRSRYDIILVDAFRGPSVPFHLMTKEFYELARNKLKTGGVLAQNLIASTQLFEATIVTLRAVFANVDFYTAEGNVVAVAYDGAQKEPGALSDLASKRQNEFRFRYPLPELIALRRTVARLPDAEVLTDDFAPVESLKAIERQSRDLDSLTTPSN